MNDHSVGLHDVEVGGRLGGSVRCVRVREVIVEDEDGNVILRIGSDRGRATIEGFSPAGQKCLRLGANEDGGYIAAYTKDGRAGVALNSTEKNPLVCFYERDGSVDRYGAMLGVYIILLFTVVTCAVIWSL